MAGDRVLVLGGAGFIGANVARAFLDAGHEVTVLARDPREIRALDGVEKRVEVVRGDLSDRASLVGPMRAARNVVHAAGHYPIGALDAAGTLRRGVTEMRNVLSAAREAGVRRLVYTSSLSTIGPSPDPTRLPDERDHYLPGSVPSSYFEVKWAMEAEAYRAVARGQDVVILNPTLALGPWDVKPTTGQLVVRLARGRLPVYVEGKVNVVHVRDVARGHVLALERGTPGERFIIGGENLWARDLLALVAREAGVRPPYSDVPYRALRAASLATEVASRVGFEVGTRLRPFAPRVAKAVSRAPALPLDGVDIFHHAQAVDAWKARTELGVPATPVADAVRDALAWFRERGYLDGHSTR